MHCISEIILTNAIALPTMIQRLRGEGIKHLRSLTFEPPGSDDDEPGIANEGGGEAARGQGNAAAAAQARRDTLQELVSNGISKVPDLTCLDLNGVVIDSAEGIRGLERLTSLKELTLPSIDERDRCQILQNKYRLER